MLYHQRLKKIREEKGLSKTQIATLLNTSIQQYSKYENGIRPIPAKHLITLCKYYNLSADYILGLIDDPVPPDKN